MHLCLESDGSYSLNTKGTKPKQNQTFPVCFKLIQSKKKRTASTSLSLVLSFETQRRQLMNFQYKHWWVSSEFWGWVVGRMCLKSSCEWVETLWVRIRDWCKKGHLVRGVCCRLPDKGNLLRKPSCSSYRRHCTHRLLSYWGTSTTLISTGKVSWRAAGNPEHSWYAWWVSS